MAKWSCFAVAALLLSLALAHAVEAARDAPAAVSGVEATFPASAKKATAVASVADKKTFWSWGGDSGSGCDCGSSGGGSLGGGGGGIGVIGGVGGGGDG